jgi:hypothetical protein
VTKKGYQPAPKGTPPAMGAEQFKEGTSIYHTTKDGVPAITRVGPNGCLTVETMTPERQEQVRHNTQKENSYGWKRNKKK